MKKILPRTLSLASLVIVSIITLGAIPSAVQAADPDPLCIFIVSTPRGPLVYEGNKEVMIRPGERVILGWIGRHASTAEDRDGKDVANVGLQVLNATGSGSYSYTFSEGRKKVTCGTDLITEADLLARGIPDAPGGEVAVSPIPLLSGGVAAAGASIPVSYVRVSNVSDEAATIYGFDLEQNGAADSDVVIGFSTSNDKGGSRATIGGAEGTVQFEDGKAFVPLKATLAAGEFRIFTIKAILSKDSSGSFGKPLMIDVSGIDTPADIRGSFPIRGTTWTLGF